MVECQLLLPQAPGIFWEGFFSFAKKESSNNPNVCISTLFFTSTKKKDVVKSSKCDEVHFALNKKLSCVEDNEANISKFPREEDARYGLIF